MAPPAVAAVALIVGEVAATIGAISGAVGIGGAAGAGLSLGGAIGGAAAVGTGISVSGLLTTAALVGLNYALTPRIPGQSVAGINDPGVTGNVRQAAPAQRIPYGRVQMGGPVFFLDDSKPGKFYLGLLLSRRRVKGIVSVKFGEHEVTFDASGNALSAPYTDGTNCYLRMSFRDGDPDQLIDPILAEAFPSLGIDPENPAEPSTFRQRGISTVVFECLYGANREHDEQLWGRVAVPNPLITLDGALVYDPRDPTQVVDDEETWKFSDNATLCEVDYARADVGVALRWQDADWQKIAASADYDDELVAILAEEGQPQQYQRRHVVSGVIVLDQVVKTVMEALLTANRGTLRYSSGSWWIASSQPKVPILTITDNVIRGGFRFRDRRPLKDSANLVRTRFVAPERGYQLADGPIREDEEMLAEHGELLQKTLRLPFTPHQQAAQRLGQQYMDEANLGANWSGPIDLALLDRANTDECVRIHSNNFPQMNGLYLIKAMGFDSEFSVLTVALDEYDPEISRRWRADNDELPFELPELDVA